MNSNKGLVLGVVVLLLLIGGSVWMHTSAPCGVFSLTPQKDIPARCVKHFSK